MKNAGAAERRQGRRFQVSWQVIVRGSDSRGIRFEEVASLRNLSSGGMFLYVEHNVSIGADIEVSIRVPLRKANWMRYSAKVVRAEPEPSRCGLAARFESLVPNFGFERTSSVSRRL